MEPTAAATEVAPVVSDADVALAVHGDEDASRRLVEGLKRPVFSAIHRFLGARAVPEIEDIAQDVFLKIFRYLHRFDPRRGTKLTTWVFAIVRNHCFDLLKKRRVETASLDSAEQGTPLDPEAPEPEQGRAVNTELGSKIQEAIEGLQPEHRLVFELRELKGLDYRAIAASTGLHEGTVKSRLHRARLALMRKLDPYVFARN